MAQSIGSDFLAALLYEADIAPCTPYAEASVVLDDLSSVTTLTLPQLRQHTLLSALRSCLVPEGEPYRLTRDCSHAGGMVGGLPQEE